MPATQTLEHRLREVSLALVQAEGEGLVTGLRAARHLTVEYRSVIDLAESLNDETDMRIVSTFYLFKQIVTDLMLNFGLDTTFPLPQKNKHLLLCVQNLGRFVQASLSKDLLGEEAIGYLFEAVRDYHLLIMSAEKEGRV